MKPIKNLKNKINESILKIMEDSVDIKLYLLQEKGPLSFTFQDEKNSKKVNVSIGSKIECSCLENNKNEHCVHTIYVLNRFFKLKFNDVLILQTGFSDAELSKMIEIRMKKNEKSENLTEKFTKHRLSTQNISQILHEDINSNRMHLSDDTSCPICQEDMYSFEKLLYCSKSCGHNFHMHCMKVWIDHKKAPSNSYETHSNNKLTCPMCRGELDEELIAKTQSIVNNNPNSYNPKQNKPHKNITCKICSRTNIKGERVHCLICENLDFCIECISKHDSNHFLVCKKHPDENWVGCEISNNAISIKNIKLSQFLINLLEYTEIDTIEENEMENEENNNTNQIASVNNFDRKCMVCNGNKKSKLEMMRYKKLNCGHIIHLKCCEKIFNFKDNDYNNKCVIDKIVIFKGLLSIKIKNPEVNKNVEGNVAKTQNSKINSINELLVVNKIGSNNNMTLGKNNKKYIPNTSSNLKKPAFGNFNSVANIDNFSLALDIQRLDFNEKLDVKTFENNEKEKLDKYKHSRPIQKRNSSVKNIKKVPNRANLLSSERRPVHEERKDNPINLNHRNIKVVDMKIMNFKVNKNIN